MKNLKNYDYFISENFGGDQIKKYGEKFPLKFLSVGDKITYLGTPCIVVEADDYVISAKPIEGSSPKTFLINQNMFDQKAFINKQDKPKNYEPSTTGGIF
jgi:hypothetical protein